MTTYTCPDGHTSTSGDYCDVCGAPIGGDSASSAAASPAAASAVSSSTPPGPSATPPPLPTSSGGALSLDTPAPPTGTPAVPKDARVCPNCSATNPSGALFCEDCGYDFTTGQMPRPLAPPAGLDTPAPSDSSTPAAVQPPPSLPAPASPSSDATPSSSSPSTSPPSTGPSSQATPAEWVVEVWVDPDWYAAQDVSDPCPSAGMPIVVPLHVRSALVGRTSVSRNIHPEIDLATDTGVSRRHAQLSTDGQRWWVEDLQSANGTYVGAAGEALPTSPVPAGQRTELSDDGRVYVGAWTRLVVRKATAAEATGTL